MSVYVCVHVFANVLVFMHVHGLFITSSYEAEYTALIECCQEYAFL